MDERDLDPDPLRQFERWFAEARDAGLAAPEAMALATATPDGRPSVRMVLLKSADERGFDFYTNYESRKGGELDGEPARGAALPLAAARPPGSRRRASRADRAPRSRRRTSSRGRSRAASPPGPHRRAARSQSRDELERRYADAEERFPGEDVPLPPHWGGFRLVPDAYEFWQHGDDRLHDRVRYERDGRRLAARAARALSSRGAP